MIYDHIETFYGKPVAQFDPKGGDIDPSNALKLSVDWEAAEAGQTMLSMLQSLAAHPKASAVEALIIGVWEEAYETSAQVFIDFLVEHGDTFANLKALFVGEMIGEENEVSWIQQGNYNDIFATFKQLTHLQIRGSEGLSLGQVNHDKLQTVILETGGLPSKVLEQLAQGSLPELTRLDLWLGTDDYGFDGELKHIEPFVDQSKFPKVTQLALCNSDLQDDICALVVNSDICGQLTKLDLSKGVMSDAGARLLFDNQDKLAKINLDVEDNFISEEMCEQLEASTLIVQIGDQEDEDEDDGEVYRYVSVGE